MDIRYMLLTDCESAAQCSRKFTEQKLRDMLTLEENCGLVAINPHNGLVLGFLLTTYLGTRLEIKALAGHPSTYQALIYELMFLLDRTMQKNPQCRTLWATLPLTIRYSGVIKAMCELGWHCDLIAGTDRDKQDDYFRLLFHVPRNCFP